MRYLIIFLLIPFMCFAETVTVKVDKDTIEIREVTTIKISDLEKQLVEEKAINKAVETEEAWMKELDSDKQDKFIRMPTIDTTILEDKIDAYKALPVISD